MLFLPTLLHNWACVTSSSNTALKTCMKVHFCGKCTYLTYFIKLLNIISNSNIPLFYFYFFNPFSNIRQFKGNNWWVQQERTGMERRREVLIHVQCMRKIRMQVGNATSFRGDRNKNISETYLYTSRSKSLYLKHFSIKKTTEMKLLAY